MHNFSVINQRPRIVPWIKRPSYRPNSKNDVPLQKNPEDYQFQIDALKDCLTDLFSKESLIVNKINSYLEIFFLIPAKDIEANLVSYIENRYSIKMVKKESCGFGSRAYFLILDFNLLTEKLKEDIDQFQKYSGKEITKDEFSSKRIALLYLFRLSTKAIKENVAFYLKSFDRLRLKISFIEEIENFPEMVSQIASNLGVTVQIYGGAVIDISDINEGELNKVTELANRIADFDKVERVSLDDFISTIDKPLEGSLGQEYNFSIREIADNAPVVAVLDTGVQRHALTSVFLTEDGLDYTSGNIDPTSGNPFIDKKGHGTRVATEIAYGRNIQDYLISNEVNELLPVARIFSIRVNDENEEFYVPYEEIFDLNGHFAKAVEKYNIKIVNISLNEVQPKGFDAITLSKAAILLDKFAKKYGTLFIVCSGNIPFNHLQNLAAQFPDLSFYERPSFFEKPTNPAIYKEINIAAPGDLLSGITVGGCYPQQSKHVIASFSKSYTLSNLKYYSKPDLVSIGSGDYPIDKSDRIPKFCSTSGRLLGITHNPGYMEFNCGTSFSAPFVSRALAIGYLKYPDFTPQQLKGVFLHKISNSNAKASKKGQHFNTSNIQNSTAAKFHDAFRGNGALIEEDEDVLFSDSEDEVTMVIGGKIKNKEIQSFSVPIVKMLGDGTVNIKNKLQLKLSVCFSPQPISTREPNSFKEANQLHISAMAHLNSLPITYTFQRGKITFREQCVTEKPETKGKILVKWTSDYYQGFYPTYYQQAQYWLKDDLFQKLGDNETITVSVRATSENVNDDEEYDFAAIFSIKDMGLTGEIRNHININV